MEYAVEVLSKQLSVVQWSGVDGWMDTVTVVTNRALAVLIKFPLTS